MKTSALPYLFLFLFSLSACAGSTSFLNSKLETPPEFDQQIILDVSDDYEMFQAPMSGYDVGDLQSFHSQHTLPILVEDAFKEMFGTVKLREKGPQIETEQPDVPAIFEVRFLDVANDVYNETDTYRGQVTLAVAMKSPRGKIFWQQAFRGDGYVSVDPQFSLPLGPQDALVDAVHNAIEQMQKAIIASPEVRTQMKYYMASNQARKQTEQAI